MKNIRAFHCARIAFRHSTKKMTEPTLKMLPQFTYKPDSFSSQNRSKNTPVSNSDSSGKEKDSETGYYYFGARYYNPDLSLWLSVDPMSDKYPSLSPYNYCAWNPVKLVDPNGEEIFIGLYTGNKKSIYTPNSKANKAGTMAGVLDKIYNGSKAGKFVINSLVKSKKSYYLSETKAPDGDGYPQFSALDADHGQIYLNTSAYGYNEGTLSHELFHAFQHNKNQFGKARSCEVEAFVFAGIVMSQMNGGKLPFGKMSSGMRDAYSGQNNMSHASIEYQKAMLSLTKGFDSRKMSTAVSHFGNFSMEGFNYTNERGYGYCLTGNLYKGSSSLLNRYKTSIY